MRVPVTASIESTISEMADILEGYISSIEVGELNYLVLFLDLSRWPVISRLNHRSRRKPCESIPMAVPSKSPILRPDTSVFLIINCGLICPDLSVRNPIVQGRQIDLIL